MLLCGGKCAQWPYHSTSEHSNEGMDKRTCDSVTPLLRRTSPVGLHPFSGLWCQRQRKEMGKTFGLFFFPCSISLFGFWPRDWLSVRLYRWILLTLRSVLLWFWNRSLWSAFIPFSCIACIAFPSVFPLAIPDHLLVSCTLLLALPFWSLRCVFKLGRCPKMLFLSGDQQYFNACEKTHSSN